MARLCRRTLKLCSATVKKKVTQPRKWMVLVPALISVLARMSCLLPALWLPLLTGLTRAHPGHWAEGCGGTVNRNETR